MILMVGDILITFWSTPVYSREIPASQTKGTFTVPLGEGRDYDWVGCMEGLLGDISYIYVRVCVCVCVCVCVHSVLGSSVVSDSLQPRGL